MKKMQMAAVRVERLPAERSFFSIKDTLRLFPSRRRKGRFLFGISRGHSPSILPRAAKERFPPILSPQLPTWTSMACVLYWLRKEGMMDVRCYRREDGAVVYVVLEEYYTSSQILCMANDRRRERDLPLFYIQDLTQE